MNKGEHFFTKCLFLPVFFYAKTKKIPWGNRFFRPCDPPCFSIFMKEKLWTLGKGCDTIRKECLGGKMMAFLWTTFWGKLLSTFLIAMVPFVELRGAIPIAALHGLPFVLAFPVAILGNMVPVPFIILFIRKIFALFRRHLPWLNRLVDRLEQKAKNKQEIVERRSFWGLFVLVAIPLPGTGAWTGALVAAMLDMRLKRAFPAIFLGVVTAGVIMAVLSYWIPGLFF